MSKNESSDDKGTSRDSRSFSTPASNSNSTPLGLAQSYRNTSGSLSAALSLGSVTGPPPLSNGEKLFLKAYTSLQTEEGGAHLGSLFLTNYRVIFRDHKNAMKPNTPPTNTNTNTANNSISTNNTNTSNSMSMNTSNSISMNKTDLKNVSTNNTNQDMSNLTSVPLATILKMESQIVKQTWVLEIDCKDFRVLRFLFPTEGHIFERVQENIRRLAFPPSLSGLFAFVNKENVDSNPKLNSTAINESRITKIKHYDPYLEFKRLGLPDESWHITGINKEYKLCDTYPQLLVVPKTASDKLLKEAANFRSKCRIPVLSWRHLRNKASLTRSSQPKAGWGLGKNRNLADESIVSMIRSANSLYPEAPLFVCDARPLANAIGNKATGAGYESSHLYSNAEIEFMGVDNIHVMRSSFMRLRELVFTSQVDDLHWYSRLENTKWLEYVLLLLTSAIRVADILESGSSVLTHCSDGWDRTSQIITLVMVLLDPYYRTIQGFIVLIEKEWISMGHKFQDRVGHGDPQFSHQERSPVFLQWIDCIWQITNQFPSSFEFNENFLIYILDCLFDCKYGTFLENCEKARDRAALRQRTVSMWHSVDQNKDTFTNSKYQKTVLPSTEYLQPISSMKFIKLWESYYLRWSVGQTFNSLNSVGASSVMALKSMENRVAQLQNHICTQDLLLAQTRQQVQTILTESKMIREQQEVNEEVKKILQQALDILQIEKDTLLNLLNENGDVKLASKARETMIVHGTQNSDILELGSVKAQRVIQEWIQEKASLTHDLKKSENKILELQEQLRLEKDKVEALTTEKKDLQIVLQDLQLEMEQQPSPSPKKTYDNSISTLDWREGNEENTENTQQYLDGASEGLSLNASILNKMKEETKSTFFPVSAETNESNSGDLFEAPAIKAGFRNSLLIIQNYIPDHSPKTSPNSRPTPIHIKTGAAPHLTDFSQFSSYQTRSQTFSPAQHYIVDKHIETLGAPNNFAENPRLKVEDSKGFVCMGCDKKLSKGHFYKMVFGGPHCLDCTSIIEAASNQTCFSCESAITARETSFSFINGEIHCKDCSKKISQKMESLGFLW